MPPDQNINVQFCLKISHDDIARSPVGQNPHRDKSLRFSPHAALYLACFLHAAISF